MSEVYATPVFSYVQVRWFGYLPTRKSETVLAVFRRMRLNTYRGVSDLHLNYRLIWSLKNNTLSSLNWSVTELGTWRTYEWANVQQLGAKGLKSQLSYYGSMWNTVGKNMWACGFFRSSWACRRINGKIHKPSDWRLSSIQRDILMAVKISVL